MKLLIIILSLFLVTLQFNLWLGKGGVREAAQLSRAIAEQVRENTRLHERNLALMAEVRDLQQGLDAIEERARNELGMIGAGETFYQIIDNGH